MPRYPPCQSCVTSFPLYLSLLLFLSMFVSFVWLDSYIYQRHWASIVSRWPRTVHVDCVINCWTIKKEDSTTYWQLISIWAVQQSLSCQGMTDRAIMNADNNFDANTSKCWDWSHMLKFAGNTSLTCNAPRQLMSSWFLIETSRSGKFQGSFKLAPSPPFLGW